MEQNESASLSQCQAELDKLSASLRESITHGAFYVPGGHSLYLEAIKKVGQDYEQVPCKGVKASEVFQNFLKSQIAVEESILQSDKALSDGQRAMAAELAKKEAAEKELELKRQQQKKQEQETETQMRSFSEIMAQLQKKMEMEKENILRDKERVLDHKLKALADLLLEGIEEKYEDLRREIKLREEEIKAMKQISIQKILDVARDILIEILPLLGDVGMKILSSYTAKRAT